MVQTVLVFGATGRTGEVITDALIKDPNMNVVVAVRPASTEKPTVVKWKNQGATVIQADITSPKEDLIPILRGVDTVVSAVSFAVIDNQLSLADAAKEAGVKRFVPCDFGTVCTRGVRQYFDQKLNVHDHIERIGLGYTYIDIGWWMQSELSEAVYTIFKQDPHARVVYGEGSHKTLLTDLRDVGPFVAKIIGDPRTLNRYVIIWGEEATQEEVLAFRSKESQAYPLVYKSVEEVEAKVASARESGDFTSRALWEYLYSIWIRGDNTLENAKKPEYGGALDARELYPDIPVHNLEQFAAEFSPE